MRQGQIALATAYRDQRAQPEQSVPWALIVCTRSKPWGSVGFLLQRELDDHCEVHVHRLAFLQRRFIAPLFHRFNRRIVETELRAWRAQHLDVPNRAILAD